MKNENEKTHTLMDDVILLVVAALWIGAAILAPMAIIKLCWLYLLG